MDNMPASGFSMNHGKLVGADRSAARYTFLYRFELTIVMAVFFFLFVADFFGYYYRSVFGTWAPPFGVISYGLTTVLFAFKLAKAPRIVLRTRATLVGLFLAFLSWATVIVLVSGRGDFSDYYLIALYGIYFFIGTQLYETLNARALKGLALLSHLTIVLVVILNVDSDFRLDLGDTGANYLRLADSFAFLSLVNMSLVGRRHVQIVTYLASAVVLFMISSRAAFFGFAFAGMLLFYLRNGLSRFMISTAWLLVFLLVLLPVIDFGLLTETRVFRLLLTPEKDTSLTGRMAMFEAGWESIKGNWFLGDFKGQLEYGGYGSYIHNGLSYWRQYGFVGFVLLLSLVTFLLGTYLVRWRQLLQYQTLAHYQLSFVTLIYTVLLVIVAKSFVYLHLFLALGMSVVALTRNWGATEREDDQDSEGRAVLG